MASRIKTYQLFRKIHLYSAFVILAFLIMYFITGYVMTHQKLIPQTDPIETKTTSQLEVPEGLSLEELSVFVQQKFNLSGKRIKPQEWKSGEINLRYSRPGTGYQALISADKNTVTITEKKFGLRQTLIQFHRVEQYGGGGLYTFYVFLMDLSSIALIVFAITGIYLWIKMEKRLIWGIIALSAGIIYTILVMFSL